MDQIYILGFSLFELLWFFFIYSVVGWMIETIYESLKQGLLVNRGFLLGCYCPIYGVGSWLIFFTLMRFKGEPLLLFVFGMILATALEYFVGWLMETTLKSKWWDYSDSKFSIKGRISLFTSLAWGLLCAVVVEYLHPLIEKMVSSFGYESGKRALVAVLAIMSFDLAVSLWAAIRLGNKIAALAGIKERAIAFILQHTPLDEVESIRQSFFSSRVGEIVATGYDRLRAAASTTMQAAGLGSALSTIHERYEQIMGSISQIELRFFKAFPSLYFRNYEQLSDEVRERAGRND